MVARGVSVPRQLPQGVQLIGCRRSRSSRIASLVMSRGQGQLDNGDAANPGTEQETRCVRESERASERERENFRACFGGQWDTCLLAYASRPPLPAFLISYLFTITMLMLTTPFMLFGATCVIVSRTLFRGVC